MEVSSKHHQLMACAFQPEDHKQKRPNCPAMSDDELSRPLIHSSKLHHPIIDCLNTPKLFHHYHLFFLHNLYLLLTMLITLQWQNGCITWYLTYSDFSSLFLFSHRCCPKEVRGGRRAQHKKTMAHTQIGYYHKFFLHFSFLSLLILNFADSLKICFNNPLQMYI